MKWRMKERSLLSGAVLSLLGLGLMAVRGVGIGYEGILGVGVALLVIGSFLKKPAPSSSA
ncbi:MAG TPA: hypothetical protein VJR06_02280 [Nitrososphaerales archaeon]|nr:hypothetical protein [Nitrososphaerales archaeon]